MALMKILPFLMLPSVLTYHFYNPLTHDILTGSSLNNIPPGYKLLPPPKNSGRDSTGRRGNSDAICSDAGFTCTTPFAKSLTFQFECDQDYQCPVSYKCCHQKCFVHKICSKSISNEPSSQPNHDCQRPGQCEKWPYNCREPYPYSFTSIFKCDHDKACPRGFKCCEQNCFLHKICSRVALAVTPIKQLANRPSSTKRPFSNINLLTKMETENISPRRQMIEKKVDTGPTTEGRRYTEIQTEESLPNTTTEQSKITFNYITESDNYPRTKEPEEKEDDSDKLTTTNDTEKSFDERIKSNNSRKLTPSSSSKAPDSNAIVPEYAEYYYHYGDNNDTTYDNDDYDDYDEEEE